LTGVDVEIWSHQKDIGNARFDSTQFQHYANGGRYTPQVGVITLPQRKNSAALNGYVYAGNRKAKKNRFEIVLFQQTSVSKSNTGYPVQGLDDTGNDNDSGYYQTSPLYPGHYQARIKDHEKKVAYVIYLDITRPDERVDFNLDENCFGNAHRQCKKE
jgi:hypothetical protein